MIRFQFYFFYLLLFYFTHSASAQISPPDFQCIREDTLFWLPDVNTCGPFMAYDIYFSSSESSPFSLLTSIDDPSVLFFVHENLAGPGYYFMQSRYDCPGQSSSSSDTLNNLFELDITHIERVSVQGDNVHIRWYPNESPQTLGYIIYRNTPLGTLPIDTVFDGLEYLDTEARPNEQVESYYVLALDICGNTTTFDTVPHKTILMQTETDFCSRHIKMTWSHYEGWDLGVESYEIWLGIDGDTLQYEHRISGDGTLAYLGGLKDEIEYCLVIKAKEHGSEVVSSGNEICEVVDVLSALDTLVIENVSVSQSQNLEVTWAYNANSDLDDISMHRGLDQALLSPTSPNFTGKPPDNVNVFIDRQIAPTGGPFFYQIQASDQCGNQGSSNVVSSIVLNVESDASGAINLNWTDLYFPERSLLEYQICKIENGNEIPLDIVRSVITNYTAMATPSSSGETFNCFVIKALHTNENGGDTLISYSNIGCANQMVNMYIPNAFVPKGVNQIFKPEVLHSGSIQNYLLQIFDRWGGKIFESNSPQIGWNGYVSGELAEPGVYLFVINIDQVDGKNLTKSGTVILIR